MSDWKPNPHIWRKMKQAERNMLLCIERRPYRRRRSRYWARQFNKWIHKVL